MMDWGEVWDTSTCSLEGVFTAFDWYYMYEGECISYDEIIEKVTEQNFAYLAELEA